MKNAKEAFGGLDKRERERRDNDTRLWHLLGEQDHRAHGLEVAVESLQQQVVVTQCQCGEEGSASNPISVEEEEEEEEEEVDHVESPYSVGAVGSSEGGVRASLRRLEEEGVRVLTLMPATPRVTSPIAYCPGIGFNTYAEREFQGVIEDFQAQEREEEGLAWMRRNPLRHPSQSPVLSDHFNEEWLEPDP